MKQHICVVSLNVLIYIFLRFGDTKFSYVLQLSIYTCSTSAFMLGIGPAWSGGANVFYYFSYCKNASGFAIFLHVFRCIVEKFISYSQVDVCQLQRRVLELFISYHPTVLTVAEHHKAFHTSTNVIYSILDFLLFSFQFYHKVDICNCIHTKHHCPTHLNKEVLDYYKI